MKIDHLCLLQLYAAVLTGVWHYCSCLCPFPFLLAGWANRIASRMQQSLFECIKLALVVSYQACASVPGVPHRAAGGTDAVFLCWSYCMSCARVCTFTLVDTDVLPFPDMV